MESEFDFCVLGSANIDKSLYVPHIPVEGETLNAHKLFVCNGGKVFLKNNKREQIKEWQCQKLEEEQFLQDNLVSTNLEKS